MTPVLGRSKALLDALSAQAVTILDNARLRSSLEIESRARAALEERLRRAEAALKVHEEARLRPTVTLAEMAGSIAHEVAQPLAGVLTNAGACRRWLDRPEPDLDEAREAVRRIARDAQRTADVVAGLRALFCSPEARKLPRPLARLLAEVLDSIGPTAEDAAVSVRTCFPEDLPPVCADAVQIQQVLSNLVLNGIDAMRATHGRPRELVIAVRAVEGAKVQVQVRDSGPGLAVPDAERMFQAFYTTKPGGMGMGLWVSRAIVRDHGGELRAYSNQDARGATFAFTLPVAIGAESGALLNGKVDAPG